MSTRLRTLEELLIFIEQVPPMVTNKRRLERLSIRVAAAQIGISSTGLSQIEHGHNYNVGSLRLILEWLNGEKQPNPAAEDVVGELHRLPGFP